VHRLRNCLALCLDCYLEELLMTRPVLADPCQLPCLLSSKSSQVTKTWRRVVLRSNDDEDQDEDRWTRWRWCPDRTADSSREGRDRLFWLSRPLLRLLLRDIGFIYPLMSMVVIDPSLPIQRQRQWSLLYDVYWFDLMMVIVNRWQVSYNGYLNGIEIPENSSGSEIAQY
jgi:hypothetical protein